MYLIVFNPILVLLHSSLPLLPPSTCTLLVFLCECLFSIHIYTYICLLFSASMCRLSASFCINPEFCINPDKYCHASHHCIMIKLCRQFRGLSHKALVCLSVLSPRSSLYLFSLVSVLSSYLLLSPFSLLCSPSSRLCLLTLSPRYLSLFLSSLSPLCSIPYCTLSPLSSLFFLLFSVFFSLLSLTSPPLSCTHTSSRFCVSE